MGEKKTTYHDFNFTIDGTLNVVEETTLTGGITGTLKLTVAPSGTTAGEAWTSGAPAFTAGQQFILVTAGATTWRIPVWDNA